MRKKTHMTHNICPSKCRRVLVLFNPYHPLSTVYIPDFTKENSRPEKTTAKAYMEEYVDNEHGRLYYGDVYRSDTESNTRGIGSMTWGFHQFDPDVVRSIVKIISWMSQSERSDPVKVARQFTNLLNHQQLRALGR